jgi:hypothetical protein
MTNENEKDLDLDALWGFDGEEPELQGENQPEEEKQIDDAAPDNEEGEEEPELEEEGELEDEEPKIEEQKHNTKQVPYKRFSKLVADKKQLEDKISQLEQRLNGVIGVNEVLNKKAPAPEKSLDEQLRDAKLNPDKYYDDDEKKEALEAKLETQAIKQQLAQQQQQIALSNTISQIDQGIAYMQQQDPAIADSVNRAINLLIDKEAFSIEENNPNLSEEQAKTQAYYAVMGVVSHRSSATGEHPANIIAKLGAKLAKKQGIDLSPKKVLPKGKEDAKINHKNREQSQKRAGRPAIDVAPSASVKIDDDTAALFASF